MQLALIAAVSRNRVIGIDGQLPWHLPADLKQFRALTLGKPVIMGRATYESIGRPLPKRLNIVVSSNPNFSAPGCSTAQNLAQAIELAGDAGEVMIIGGQSLYQEALPRADRLYLTEVDTTVIGDRHFPEYPLDQWREHSRECHRADETNPHDYCFVALQRIRPESS